MHLKWSEEYFDYGDAKGWQPKLEALKAEFENHPLEKALDMEVGQLLNLMESINQLMDYYAYREDMVNLEIVMRRQKQFLDICRKKDAESVGFCYLDMNFSRLDAALYRHFGKNRKAAECLRENIGTARKCFRKLQQDNSLSDEQKLFAGWSCVENYKEAASAFDAVIDSQASFQCLKESYSMLEWLEPYFGSADGISERAAELYSVIAQTMYQNRRISDGRICYGRAINIFRRLDGRYEESNYYYARSLWAFNAYGIAEAVFSGKAQLISECEKETKDFLDKGNLNELERGIAEGAMGMAIWQKGLLSAQTLKTAESINWLEKSSKLLKSSLKRLEKSVQSQLDFRRNAVMNIASGVFSTYLGILHSLGSQYYCSGQMYLSQDRFLEVLKLLADSESYKAGETAAALVRADASGYLALINADYDDEEAVFYAQQSVEASEKLGKTSNSPAAWGICIRSSYVLSDLYLKGREKEKALLYAEKGMQACDALYAMDEENENLVIREKLLKIRKKAMRKFF